MVSAGLVRSRSLVSFWFYNSVNLPERVHTEPMICGDNQRSNRRTCMAGSSTAFPLSNEMNRTLIPPENQPPSFQSMIHYRKPSWPHSSLLRLSFLHLPWMLQLMSVFLNIPVGGSNSLDGANTKDVIMNRSSWNVCRQFRRSQTLCQEATS